MLDSHISTCINKDTLHLFILCIMLVCQLYRVDFISVVRFILLLFNFHLSFVHLLFDFLFSFDYFAFYCSLFVVQEKIFNSDPGLHSRYFDLAVSLYKKFHHHLCKSIITIHKTAPTLS
jgi:hypothetical protein